MNNETTNKALAIGFQIAESEMVRVAQTAMCNAYDNILEMLSIQMNNYSTVLHDPANVLNTSYGSRFDKIYNQKQKVWNTYYKIQEIYGKVAEMRYNNQIKVTR